MLDKPAVKPLPRIIESGHTILLSVPPIIADRLPLANTTPPLPTKTPEQSAHALLP